MNRPRSNIVRLVGWQYSGIAGSSAAVIAAIIAAALSLGLTSYYLAPRTLRKSAVTGDTQAAFITNRILRDIRDKIGNGTTVDLSEILGNLTIIKDELQDLNCAVHKCEDFDDSADPFSLIMDVADFLSDFDNVTGFLESLVDDLIEDERCLHFYGMAKLSHNVHTTCIDSNDYALRSGAVLCNDNSCQEFNEAPRPLNCPSNTQRFAFGSDYQLLVPTYYVKSLPFDVPYPFDSFQFGVVTSPTGMPHIYAYSIKLGTTACEYYKSKVLLHSFPCSAPETIWITPFPQPYLRRRDCCNYPGLGEVQCGTIDSIDCSIEDIVSRLVGGTLPNISFAYRDQNLVIPAIDVVYSRRIGFDNRIPYITDIHPVNVTFGIDFDYATYSRDVCFK